MSWFFFCLVIEPVIELHLPWKYSSALLHYLLFHSPCDNIEDCRQHFPVHTYNSLFLLFHFQTAPWADSQASPQEGHEALSHIPMCPHCGLPTLLYPPPSTSSFFCLCSESCCGAGSQRGSGEVSAG